MPAMSKIEKNAAQHLDIDKFILMGEIQQIRPFFKDFPFTSLLRISI